MASRRTNVLLLCVAFAVFGATWGTLNSVVAELKRAYGFDERTLGLLLLVPPVFGAPSALAGNRIVARLGCARMIGLGSATLAGGLLLLGSGLGAWTPWVALPVMGTGSGMMDVGILTAASRIEGDGGGGVVGRVQAFFFVGLVSGGAIGTAAVGTGLGYRAAFGAVACIVLVAGQVAARTLRLAPVAPHPDGRPSIRASLRVPGVVALIALAFGGFFLEGASTSWTAVFVRDTLAGGAAVASAAALLVNLGLAVGAGGADAAIARAGVRWTMGLGALVAAVGIGAAAAAPTPAVAIVGMVVAAMGFGGIGPAAFTLTGRVDRANGGGVLPTVTALGYVAFLIGPFGVGQVGQVAGLRVALAIVAAAALCLAVFVARVRLPEAARVAD